MAAYRRVYDLCHLQADCQEPGSAPEPYARQSSVGYLYLLFSLKSQNNVIHEPHHICLGLDLVSLGFEAKIWHLVLIPFNIS